MPDKIFCIGFQKTGTRSLTTYLDRLGFKSVHWVKKVDGIDYECRVIPYLDDMERVLDVLEPVIDSYQAFTDVPFPALYPELDRRYADSKFILVTRDMDKWWQSLSNHQNLHKRKLAALAPYEYIQYNRYSDRQIIYITFDDKDIFIDIHRKHVQSTKDYFVDRPGDFLQVDLDDPAIGARINDFLGKSCDEPFPHEGKHQSKRWQPPGRPQSAWRRWYRSLYWRARLRLGLIRSRES